MGPIRFASRKKRSGLRSSTTGDGEGPWVPVYRHRDGRGPSDTSVVPSESRGPVVPCLTYDLSFVLYPIVSVFVVSVDEAAPSLVLSLRDR